MARRSALGEPIAEKEMQSKFKDLRARAKKGDPEAMKMLNLLEDLEFDELRKQAYAGNKVAIKKLA
jgi:hypothetical protein